jgi:hypothetical protein
MHDMCLCECASVLRCVSENVCVRFVFTSCVDRIAVCVLCQCGNIYTYRLHFWQMQYGVRVLHLQHRHVLRRFHMRCMLAILQMHIPCICISVEVVVCALD